MTALRLALGLFTIVPAGDRPEPSRSTVRRALLLAPVVGLALGTVGAVILIGIRAITKVWVWSGSGFVPLSALVASALTIGALQIATGGLHMDGVADSADGLAARGDAQRTLAVMRDPSVGAAGAMAVCLILLIDVVALALAVVNGHGTQAIVVSFVTGRVALVWAACFSPARPEGMGAWVGGSVGWRAALTLTAVSFVVPLGLAVLDDDPARTVLPFSFAAIAIGIAAGLAAIAPLRRRLGGITGDLLGATIEVATTAALLVMAFAV